MIQRVSSVSIYQSQVEDRTWFWWRNNMGLLRNHCLSLHIRVQFRTFTLVLKLSLRQDKQNSCLHSWEGGKSWLSFGIPDAIFMLWISHDAVMWERCSYLGNRSGSWITLNKERQRWWAWHRQGLLKHTGTNWGKLGNVYKKWRVNPGYL